MEVQKIPTHKVRSLPIRWRQQCFGVLQSQCNVVGLLLGGQWSCRFLLDQLLSVRPSVRSWSTAETVRDTPIVYSSSASTTAPFPKLGADNPELKLLRKLQPNRSRYTGGLYWQSMGTLSHCRRPTKQHHHPRLGARLHSQKHAEHRPRCDVYLPCCLQTFHM